MLDAAREIGTRTSPRLMTAAFPAHKIAYAAVMLFLFLMAAGASFNSFFSKWQLRDGDPKFGVEAMLDASAARPYVYRQLVPVLANRIAGLAPTALREQLGQRVASANGNLHIDGAGARDPRYALRYAIVYYATFLAAFLSVVFLWRVGVQFFSPAAAALAAVGTILSYPFFMTGGGYFYDYFELMFMALAALCALRNRRVQLAAVIVLAVLNKESFLFFLPLLYPLIRMNTSRPVAMTALGLYATLGVAATLAVHWHYRDNPGVVVFFQLWPNLLYYLNPANLFGFDRSFGLALPSGYNIVILLFLAVLGRYAWPAMSEALRNHVAIGAAITFPLWILFCSPGEMRNLSLMLVAFFLLLAAAAQKMQGEQIAKPT